MTTPTYVKLTITDKQNGNQKVYKVEAGSRLKLTNSIHDIKKDTTIDVTLPQYQAMQVFDYNKDGKLDTTDENLFTERHQKYLDSLPEEAFDGLYHEDEALVRDIESRLGNSKFHITADGGGNYAGVDKTGFWVDFENEYWYERTENYDHKEICFQTPNQVQYTDEMQAKEDARLDTKYAKKHWFRNLLGISRNEYEQNHERDY